LLYPAPKARIAAHGFLVEKTGDDGEFVVPDGTDDVAREILAAILAAGFSVQKSDFAAVLNPIGVAHIHDVIARILSVGHIRERVALRPPRTVRRQKIYLWSLRAERGREK